MSDEDPRGHGALYVVATPIGNLSDITLRAIEILTNVSVIACEDTRVTAKLLARYSIRTPTVSLHAHSGADRVEQIVERIARGEDVAYVSDAGSPTVSDPGSELVAAAVGAGYRVVPIPGASAVVAALMASGLPTPRVVFLGFLPRAQGAQTEILAPFREVPYAIVVYESPRRLVETLESLERVLGDRRACVAREITKQFETFERGRLSELAERLGSGQKGEVVIVVAPAESKSEAPPDEDRIRSEVRELLRRGERASETARIVSGAFGIGRKEAYAIVMDEKTRSQPRPVSGD